MGKHLLKQLWEQSSEPSLNIRPLLPAVSPDTFISSPPPPRNQKGCHGSRKSGWCRKKRLFQSGWFCYAGAPLILLLRGFNFDACLAFTHSARDMKHFPFAFFPSVLWTTTGIWTAVLLKRGKRWRLSPLTALVECDLVFSSLWGRRGCYLALQQRNLGCHFARHQQRPRADSVSRVRSQVRRWEGGYGMVCFFFVCFCFFKPLLLAQGSGSGPPSTTSKES